MTTEPTTTPDTPPMPELPEGYRIKTRGVYLEKYSKVLSIWRTLCRTDSWEFAALMASLWESQIRDPNDAISWEYRNAWQRIAESRMSGE